MATIDGDKRKTLPLSEVVRSARAVAVRSLETALAPTGPLRRLPNFLVIGTQRGGTTSLYHYLVQHPDVVRPLHKEVAYFSRFYARGPNWYRGHFPLRATSGDGITFEASPSYMFDPRAPARAKDLVPDARIVALIRNPTARAFSHYQLSAGRGYEDRTFDDALRLEPARLAGEVERMLADDRYDGIVRRHYSYATRGLYHEQLQGWTSAFGRDRLLVLRSEDLYADTAAAFRRVASFLEIDPDFVPDFAVRTYPLPDTVRQLRMSPETKGHLDEFFAEPNARLGTWLGWPTGW